MKLFCKTIILFLLPVILYSCNNDTQERPKEELVLDFVKNIISGNYQKCNPFLVEDQRVHDSAIFLFDGLRYRVTSEFEHDLQFKHIGYAKTLLNLGIDKEDQYQHQSLEWRYVQIEDKRMFSLFRVGLTAKGKVVAISMLNELYRKPNMKYFWAIGIVFLMIVLTINIYAAIRVYRSNVVKKYLKYITIVLFNIPVLGCNALTGPFFNLFSFQLFGIGFGNSNYFETFWTIGFPLGALFVLWKLRNNLFRTVDDDLIYEESINATIIEHGDNTKNNFPR